MSHRGRQYYDPILQVPGSVAGEENKERIEVFPVGMDSPSRLASEVGKWASRRIDPTGAIVDQGPSAGQQDEAISQAQQKWPGLEIYFLQAEIEDSTWEGVGPTPRLWQQGRTEHDPPMQPDRFFVPAPEAVTAVEMPEMPQMPAVIAMRVDYPGTYLRLEDLLVLLEQYAVQFDDQGNPSAALGIRETAAAVRSAF